MCKGAAYMCAGVLGACIQHLCTHVRRNVRRTLSKSFFALYSIRFPYCIQSVSRAVIFSYTVRRRKKIQYAVEKRKSAIEIIEKITVMIEKTALLL